MADSRSTPGGGAIAILGNSFGAAGSGGRVLERGPRHIPFAHLLPRRSGRILGGAATINSSRFSGSTSLYGGAIYATTQVGLTNTTVDTNNAVGFGGGMYVGEGAVASVNSSTFDANTANGSNNQNGDGGAIYNAGNLTVAKSTLSNNKAIASAAAAPSGTPNRGTGLGGGIYSGLPPTTTWRPRLSTHPP